jgi:hypothetical protein
MITLTSKRGMAHISPMSSGQLQGGYDMADLHEIIRYFSALREKGVIGDEAYRELIRYAISVVIGREVEQRLIQKLERALNEKLSPKQLLDALT